MTSAIEDTVKALVEFESALERAREEAAEFRRSATKNAADWAEAARTSTIARAQAIAADRLEVARKDAEAEAAKIRSKGDTDLAKFEASISSRKPKAAELVARRLLGEAQ